MRILRAPFPTVAFLAALLVSPDNALSHGFAGKRFFPATLSTDDPFVADELSLPTVSSVVTSDEGGTRANEVSVEIAKRITPNLGIEAGETFQILQPRGERSVSGFGNLELGAKYEFFENDEHESILSLGLGVEIGGTGSKRVDADTFSTWTPALFFGKGMGDLPQGLSMLRPLAITGVISVAVPTSASTRTFTANEETGSRELESERHPNVLQYGFAVEYSFIYLQQQVKDIGLRAPFDHLIPLVELGFETPLDRGQRGQTTGTINPGMIWSGKYFQAGAEAIIPMNSRTGSEVGFVAQLHFYLDEICSLIPSGGLYSDENKLMNWLKNICLMLLFSGAAVAQASAHAFLDHAEPAVGGRVKQMPHQVRIWFTEPIELARSASRSLMRRESGLTGKTCMLMQKTKLYSKSHCRHLRRELTR